MGNAHSRSEVDYWMLRDYWTLPDKYRDKVCHGYRLESTAGHRGFYLRKGVPTCSDCNRPPFWLIFKCVSCEELFIKDFNDPKFCSGFPHCWAHLPDLSWSHCPDHTVPIYRNDIGLFPSHPPSGLNPRTYTKEELANVFPF